MKSSDPVFVLDSQKNSPLTDYLFDFGVIPISRMTIYNALKVIRHEKLRAILINNRSVTEDVLEFVLNVRDFNQEVPIIIAGIPDDPTEEKALKQQVKVSFLESCKLNKDTLKKKIIEETSNE